MTSKDLNTLLIKSDDLEDRADHGRRIEDHYLALRFVNVQMTGSSSNQSCR